MPVYAGLNSGAKPTVPSAVRPSSHGGPGILPRQRNAIAPPPPSASCHRVPVYGGPRLGAKLRDYRQQRERWWGLWAGADPLFSFGPERTQSIHPGTISQTFHQLWPRLQIILPEGVAPPRLHCLRHSFAVSTLLGWYRAGIDPNARLVQLSTFLGHAHPSSTAVYLTITADLFEEASRRFERFACPLLEGVTR